MVTQTLEVKQHMETHLKKEISTSTTKIMNRIDESTDRTINTMMEFWSSMNKNFDDLKATTQTNHWKGKKAECKQPWDRIIAASEAFNRMLADFETQKWWIPAHCTGSVECDSAFVYSES